MSPKLSIIMPVCNVENYLADCLDSALRQSFQDVEIICINDGSTDGSLEILHKYEKQDSRVKVIDKPNAGYGAAMNDGLDAATGTYVGILESDDYVCEHAWEKLYALATKSNLDIVKGCYLQFSETKESFFNAITKVDRHCPTWLPQVPFDTVFTPKDYPRCFWMNPSIWTGIYKRDFLLKNNIRFNETPGASYQDTSFAFKVWVSAERAMATETPVIHYRLDSAFSSSNSRAKVFAVCGEMDECEEFLDSRNSDGLFYHILCALRYKTYLWNIGRVSAALKLSFLDRMRGDFLRDIELNRFDAHLFDDASREEYLAIAGVDSSSSDSGPSQDQQTPIVLIPQKDSGLEESNLFTIIVPFANNERHLPECLESIESQTCKEYEVVLVDTGSSDGSFPLASEYASRNNTTLLRLHGATAYDAIIAASRQASGNFIQLLMPSDRLESDALASISDQLNDYDLDLVVHGVRAYYETPFVEKKYQKKGNPFASHRLYPSISTGELLFAEMEEADDFHDEIWSMVFSKELLKKAAIPSRYTELNDHLLALQLILLANRAGCSNRGTYIRRITDYPIDKPVEPAKKILSRLEGLGTLQNLLESRDDDYLVWHALDAFCNEWARLCRVDYRNANTAQRNEVLRCCSKEAERFLTAIRWGVRPDELRISYERRGNRLQRELNEATKAGRAVKTARNLSARLRQLRSSAKRLTQLGGKRTQETPHLVSKTSPKTLIVLDSAECSSEMQSCVILARILTELGEKSTVVIPEKGALEVVLNTERVPYRIFPIFKEAPRTTDGNTAPIKKEPTFAFDRKVLAKLAKYIEEEHFDIVHCINYDGLYGALAAAAANVPSIFHLRSSIRTGAMSDEIITDALSRVGAIYAASDTAARTLSNRCPRVSAQVIYDGAEPHKFYSLHGRTNLDHLRAVFCVEALTKSAAEILSSALAAVSELTQKRSGTTCSIAIIAERLDDNAMVILQSTIAEKELSGSVGVFGSRSDMPELWHCSDIALMISDEDLSVSTGVGAMMAGVPLLCAANNPCSEIIENGATGCILAETNLATIESAIEDVIDNSAPTHKMSVDAQQVARFCYTLEETARIIHQLHKDFFANQIATA